VDTSEQTLGRRRRRRHSATFKAEAVGACQQTGVSIAAVALERGLNANLLRRWVHEAERTGAVPVQSRAASPVVVVEDRAGFVPVALSSSQGESPIRIKLRRGSRTVSIEWPVAAARACALLLRELMR